MDLSEHSDRSTNTSKDSLIDSERCSSTQSARNDEDKSGDEARTMDGMTPMVPRKINYISAFRPVIKDPDSIAKLYGTRGSYNSSRKGYLSPDFLSESSSYRSASPCVDSDGEPDVDVETNNKSPEDEDSRGASSLGLRALPGQSPAHGLTHGLTHGLLTGDVEPKAAPDVQRMGGHVAQSSEKDVQSKPLPENHVATSYAEVSRARLSPNYFHFILWFKFEVQAVCFIKAFSGMCIALSVVHIHKSLPLYNH